MIDIFKGELDKHIINDNPDKIYIFDDNDARQGDAGQNIVRTLGNVIGIRTKKKSNNLSSSFYKDEEYESNILKIRQDILHIKYMEMCGKSIIFSNKGYGIGSSNLKTNAPRTLEYLNNLLKYYFNYNNIGGKRWSRIPSHKEITNGEYVSFLKESVVVNKIFNPVNNSLYRKDLLESGYLDLLSLIRNNKKISFIQNRKYKQEDILLLEVYSGVYCVVIVIESYDLSEVDRDYWSMFEGFNESFLSDIKNTDGMYQTHFKFISTIDENGEMNFEKNIFGGNDVSIDEIEKKEYKKIGYPVNDKNKNLEMIQNEDIVNLLNDMRSDIINIKKEIEDLRVKNKNTFNFTKFLKRKTVYDFLKKNNITYDSCEKIEKNKKYKGSYYYIVVNEHYFFIKEINFLFISSFRIIFKLKIN